MIVRQGLRTPWLERPHETRNLDFTELIQNPVNLVLQELMALQDASHEVELVDPRRVPTKDNTSDVFTKTLGVDDINRLRPGLTGYGPLPVIPESMPT